MVYNLASFPMRWVSLLWFYCRKHSLAFVNFFAINFQVISILTIQINMLQSIVSYNIFGHWNSSCCLLLLVSNDSEDEELDLTNSLHCLVDNIVQYYTTYFYGHRHYFKLDSNGCYHSILCWKLLTTHQMLEQTEADYMVNTILKSWLSEFCLQESVTEKRLALGSSQGIPDWPWQIHGQVNATQVPLFSAAASSGFSFSATHLPAAIHPPRQPGLTAHNLHFTPAKASLNSSQYRHQFNPQQAPP